MQNNSKNVKAYHPYPSSQQLQSEPGNRLRQLLRHKQRVTVIALLAS